MGDTQSKPSQQSNDEGPVAIKYRPSATPAASTQPVHTDLQQQKSSRSSHSDKDEENQNSRVERKSSLSIGDTTQSHSFEANKYNDTHQRKSRGDDGLPTELDMKYDINENFPTPGRKISGSHLKTAFLSSKLSSPSVAQTPFMETPETLLRLDDPLIKSGFTHSNSSEGGILIQGVKVHDDDGRPRTVVRFHSSIPILLLLFFTTLLKISYHAFYLFIHSHFPSDIFFHFRE